MGQTIYSMKKTLRPSSLVALVLTCFVLRPAFAQDAEPFFETEALFPLTADHVHGATLVELPNGDLLAGWFQGSGERQADDVAVRGARLPAGQSTWTASFVLADVPDFPDINPVLFLDPDERLWLLWYTVLANQWETSLPKYRISTDYSGDGPPRWQWQEVLHFKPGGPTERGIQPDDPFAASIQAQFERYEQTLTAQGVFDREGARAQWQDHVEQVLAHARGENMMRRGRLYTEDGTFNQQPMGYPHFRRLGWQTRNKPLFLNAGRMIVPFYSDGFSFSIMALTDDGGATWQFSTPLVGAGNIQPALGRRSDGTLVAFMRDNGPPPKRLHVSTSSDDGRTWSDVHDSDLANSGSAADLVVLQNGLWALVWNDTERGRARLTVALSADEGHTWPWRRPIEWDQRDERATQSHYPAIIQTADGLLHVLYSYHHEDREGARKTIKHARFNELWVRGDSE